jgi:hypothetical protein
LAIARHSLRGSSSAIAGTAKAPSSAKMAKSDRNIREAVPNDAGNDTVSPNLAGHYHVRHQQIVSPASIFSRE